MDCVLISNPGEVTSPFWPADRKRLFIVFESLVDDKVIARGIDPEKDAIVFKAKLPRGQQSAFLDAIAKGVTAEPIPPSNQNQRLHEDAGEDERAIVVESVLHYTVVITGTGSGDGPGPKFRISLVPPVGPADAAVAAGA